MANRFQSAAFFEAITGSGITGANNVEIDLQETDGTDFNATGQPTFGFNTNDFATSGSVTPSNNTTLGGKTADGSTELGRLQWRIDFGGGLQKFYRIDGIDETDIEIGETVTVKSGSLECGTTGLANVIRDGLPNVSIDVEVVDNGGTVQATFNSVSYSYRSTDDTFFDNDTLEFKNNTGSSFTIDKINVYADNDLFFSVNRNDTVPDGAEVDITGLSNTITNLS